MKIIKLAFFIVLTFNSLTFLSAMEKKPTYCQMARKELCSLATQFTDDFKKVSKENIEIYETCEFDGVHRPYVRIDDAHFLRPLCLDVEALIEKHKLIANEIEALVKNIDQKKVVWIEHVHKGRPFMMPYYRLVNQSLHRMSGDAITDILNQHAHRTPLNPALAELLNKSKNQQKNAQEKKSQQPPSLEPSANGITPPSSKESCCIQ